MNPIQIFGSTVELNCFTFAVTQYGEKIIPNAAIIQESAGVSVSFIFTFLATAY